MQQMRMAYSLRKSEVVVIHKNQTISGLSFLQFAECSMGYSAIISCGVQVRRAALAGNELKSP
jgi:hypothetical protein